jgi:O-methyltransferase involved in polyketide biosynthesis
VVEIDHPATQAWKRQCLAEADLAVPELVTFVATDFSSEPLPATKTDCRESGHLTKAILLI